LSLYEWGWELVQEGRPLAAMAEALQAEYIVASAPVMAAVLALVVVFLHEGLMQTPPGARHARRVCGAKLLVGVQGGPVCLC
jgi:hypothetical protein